jgi:hypothetical protein
MSPLMMKSFFGASLCLRTLRQDLDLSADEQFLALAYAMCGVCADGGMTPDDALKLVKEMFDKNFENAKAGSKKSRGKNHGS